MAPQNRGPAHAAPREALPTGSLSDYRALRLKGVVSGAIVQDVLLLRGFVNSDS